MEAGGQEALRQTRARTGRSAAQRQHETSNSLSQNGYGGKHPGGTQEAPRRRPGSTQEVPRRRPGGTQGSRTHLEARSHESGLSLERNAKSSRIPQFHDRPSRVQSILTGYLQFEDSFVLKNVMNSLCTLVSVSSTGIGLVPFCLICDGSKLAAQLVLFCLFCVSALSSSRASEV